MGTWSVQMESDPQATKHPDVYQAWCAAGGNENIQTVAKLPELGKWAVGFGGKKNAERAAKLALAVSIACDSEKTAEVMNNYPQFGKFLAYLGIAEPSTPQAQNFAFGASGSGKGFRASPY